MYKGKKILAFVPARGGSKGIPKKNILQIESKPLIQYTLDVASKCSYIDKVFISTDDEKIKSCVEVLGYKIPFLRPKELAGDETPTILAILDTIKTLKLKGEEFDYLMLLQPTQPFRKVFHLEESIKKIIDNGLDDLVSVSLVNEHPILIRQVDKRGKLMKLIDTNSSVRRQDFQEFYKVNGSIYINKVESLNSESSLNDNINPYIMDSKYDIDIDDMEDVEKFTNILQKYRNE